MEVLEMEVVVVVVALRGELLPTCASYISSLLNNVTHQGPSSPDRLRSSGISKGSVKDGERNQIQNQGVIDRLTKDQMDQLTTER